MRKEEYTANAHKMIIIIILLFSLVFMPFHEDDEHILKESAMLLQFMFRLCENVIAILGRRWWWKRIEGESKIFIVYCANRIHIILDKSH